jgi:LysR family transcriptional regulator AphB
MAKAGRGLLYVPLSQCADAIESGELLTILPNYCIPKREIYAIWPTQKLLPARVRALLDLLIEVLSQHPFVFQSPTLR